MAEPFVTDRVRRVTEQHSESGPVLPREELGPVLADSARIAARADADEAAARDFRARLHEASLAPLDPDETVGPELGTGEFVFAVRPSTLLEWVPASMHAGGPVGGSFYVTSSRLLHLGAERTAVDLQSVEETQVLGERLLVLLGQGESFALDVDQPRLLRVQIAAVVSSQRGASLGEGKASGVQIPAR
jgi:hypothetical protein